MKKLLMGATKRLAAHVLLLGTALAVVAHAEMEFGKLVDPFWGTGGTQSPLSEGPARGWHWEKAQTGNTHPGAVLPFGWVSACAYSGAYPSGYGRFGCSWSGPAPEIDARNHAYGFTHFQHSGVGWIGKFYNYLLFTPFVEGSNVGRASRLDDEVAHPGYYAARLSDYGASFELAPRPFAVCHRYRFQSDVGGRLLIDVRQCGLRQAFVRKTMPTYRGEQLESCMVKAVAPGRWDGSIRAHGFDIHFSVCASSNVTARSCRDGFVEFSVNGRTAETAIGFSRKGPDEAAVQAGEALFAGFDRVRAAAGMAWERQLGRIRVRFPDRRLDTRFYSTLYHSLLKPVDTGCGYVDFSTFWDIYKTEFPLVLSIAPETGRGMVDHVMQVTERKGFAPICQIMDDAVVHKDIQATALPVFSLADAFFRGVLTTADYPRLKQTFGREFAHADISGMSPTHTLDLSGAYGAAAYVAEACGDHEYAMEMRRRADVWRQAYDPSTGLLHEKATYYEGNHFNYSFRPHPYMAARVGMAGGVDAFRALLDTFFCFDRDFSGWRPENDRIRRVNHCEGLNNESDMETPFAYIWCGRPDRTAYLIDLVRRCRFADGEGGCPGNNDSGGTSSWYVWSCLGLYPLTGTPYYLLGTPSVDSAEIDFANGVLKIVVERESVGSIYPVLYDFDGETFRSPWLPVGKVEKGGTLTFRLADRPAGPAPIPDWL